MNQPRQSLLPWMSLAFFLRAPSPPPLSSSFSSPLYNRTCWPSSTSPPGRAVTSLYWSVLGWSSINSDVARRQITDRITSTSHSVGRSCALQARRSDNIAFLGPIGQEYVNGLGLGLKIAPCGHYCQRQPFDCWCMQVNRHRTIAVGASTVDNRSQARSVHPTSQTATRRTSTVSTRFKVTDESEFRSASLTSGWDIMSMCQCAVAS